MYNTIIYASYVYDMSLHTCSIIYISYYITLIRYVLHYLQHQHEEEEEQPKTVPRASYITPRKKNHHIRTHWMSGHKLSKVNAFSMSTM